MKPEKLPSGNWRVRLYVGKENGKPKYLTFTDTTKKGALLKALEYKENTDRTLTVGVAIDNYVRDRESELSPTTTQSYKSLRRNQIPPIENIPLSALTIADIQKLISAAKVSAKTKHNILGLISSALKYSDVDLHLSKVKVKDEKKQKIKTPTHEQVKTLLDNSSGELKLIIALGALCGLRRGEIFALRSEQVNLKNKTLEVDSARVRADGKEMIKPPKTESSNRTVDMPDLVCSLIADHLTDKYVIKGKMNSLMGNFEDLRSLHNINIRFHDLRHYFASFLLLAGTPTTYAMAMGGWSSPHTLKRVYEDIFPDAYKDEKARVNNLFNEKFSD